MALDSGRVLADGLSMTVFLVLVVGALFAIVFGQVSGTRKVGALHASQLRALHERIEALESVPRAERGHAPKAASAVEPAVVPPPAVPDAAGRTAVPSERPKAHEPEPSAPPVPGLGERIAAQLRSGWDQWIAQNLLAVAGGIFVLLGASFFVAVAISNGWLTPWRQVAAALIGGALLLAAGWRTWPADASRRAAHILSQSLVGSGAGVMLLGVVAGARIYHQPLYPSFVGLIGAGAISALVVAIAVRWNAQITAALGITTAIAAPLLVDAPPTTPTIAFLLVALAGSAFAIAFRGWPWLLQVAIIASLPQPAMWAIDDRLAGDHQPAAVAVAILVAWWALLALPALFFELRANSTRLRMPTSSALFQVAGLSVLFGWLEFGSVHDAGFETLLCVLAACHLVAGAVMLRVRPSSRPGAVFVWAIGAALAAGAGAVMLGGAAQPAFWGVEALAMLWLYVLSADKQAGITAAVLGALAFGYSISLAPPIALAHSLSDLATGALALVAVVAMLGGAAFLLRRMRDVAIGFAVATWVALFYLVGVVIVDLAGSATGPVDQAAQLLVTGASAALATAACLAAIALPLRFRAGVRTVAELSLWTVAAKALLVDSLGLGVHEQRLLWLLAGLAALAAVLVLAEERLRAATFSLPLATPFAAVLVISGLTQPGVDAYRAGTPHLIETLAVLALALAASGLALWRYPAARRADALVVAVVLVVEALALATVTLLTTQLGTTSENALRAASVGPLMIGLALLGGAMLGHRLPGALRRRARDCAAGVLALSAVLTVGNTAAYGATGGAIAVAGFWLAAAVALSLSVRRRPNDQVLLGSVIAAVATCAFALVVTAPPEALAYGAANGWWALIAAAIAAAAAVAAAWCAPLAWRTGAIAAALLVALYGVSVLVVTALTPNGDHTTQVAQLALSVVWTIWGVALLGAGVVRTSTLGIVLRRSGIALAGIAAAKVLIVDTARFDTAHRAGVFLALGLILLAGAWAYARLTKKLEATTA